MEKHQYASAPPHGNSPPGEGALPPSYDGHINAYPPTNSYPPTSYPPNNYPPNNYPPNNYPPNNYPSNNYPPNNYPPNAYPPNPPSSYPAHSYPSNNYPTTTPPQQQTTTSTIVVTGGPGLTNYGPNCQTVTCPYCHHFVTTKVENKATTKTHLIALILCLCSCWLCCCCPYCMDSCQGRDHYCPQCKAFLGSYIN